MFDVADVITGFVNSLKTSGYAESTLDNYGRNLACFKQYLLAGNLHDLRAVAPQIILDYQRHVAGLPLAEESKALRLRPVKRLFEHLVDEHRLLINPAEGIVETRRKHRKIGPVLTLEEMKALLACPDLSLATGTRDRAILEVFYSSGIRLRELLNLDTYDADLKELVLFIRSGKGRKDRVVPMGKNAAKRLEAYLRGARPKSDGSALFLNRSGHPLTGYCIHALLRKYRMAAGIEKPVSPHTLRRTCATHLLQQGADIRYIQELLGHERLETTQAYTGVMPVEVKRTHERTHPNNGR
jgi:integrase/recombinase XerD